MTERTILQIESVAKRYGASLALDDVSLSVEAGSYVVLLGPSGSGKTTLLSILGGFTQPTSGRILIAGTDVTETDPAKRPTATVFQDYALFPHMDVLANVGFGLRMRGLDRTRREAQAETALAMVGLAGLGRRRIHEMSGGQRQRVALARALVVEPEILLLDEPLGALDLNLRRQMQDELARLSRDTGRTFVHVTHDQEEAMALADLVVLMNKGRIEDFGPPEQVYARPRTHFAARFMGESVIIQAEATNITGSSFVAKTQFGNFVIAGPPPQAGRIDCVIRPEDIGFGERPGDAVPFCEAVVERATYVGGARKLELRALDGSGAKLLARVTADRTAAEGETVHLWLRPAALVALPPEGAEP